MYNWNTDTTILQKNPAQHTIWQLEQLINYGLNGQKLNKELVKKYWDRLHIDPHKKNVLAFWLWHKQS